MGIQLLSLGHQFYGVADTTDTVSSQVLEGNLPTITVEVHTVVGSGIAVSGQGVVRATGIVTGTLTGILSEEHTAGVDHLLGEFLEVLRLDDQMLWGIGIREGDGLFLVLDEYQRAVLQCLLCYLLTGQQFQLAVHLCLYIEDNLFRGGDEQHL